LNKRNQILLIQSGAAVAFILVLAIGTLLVYRGRHPVREAPREEFRAFYRMMDLGESPEQVRSKFRLQNYQELTLAEDNPEPGIWEISTPFEWNAGNWIMWVVFRDGEVHGIIVGTQDDMFANPQGAPRDKMTEELEAWLNQQQAGEE
jgi:hypothetical protein